MDESMRQLIKLMQVISRKYQGSDPFEAAMGEAFEFMHNQGVPGVKRNDDNDCGWEISE